MSSITDAAKVPTNVDSTDPVHSGYITYVDTIGDYMHVQNVKSPIWAGTEFKKVASAPYTGDTTFLPAYAEPSKGAEGSGITKYTLEGSIESPVYGTHNAREIDIFTYTNDEGRQVLVVRIPASAIPLRVERVGVNADGSVNTDEEFTPYTGTDDAYPLRLVYSVSLNDDVLNANGTLNTAAVSEEYLAAHANNDGVVSSASSRATTV